MKKILPLLAMLISNILIAQIPNSGFENWSNDIDGNYNPDSWQTSNMSSDTSVLPYTPSCSGNYAVLVRTTDVGFVFPGLAYIDFPFTQRPTQLNFCYSATITPGDEAYVMFYSHLGDSIIGAQGNCTFRIDTSSGMPSNFSSQFSFKLEATNGFHSYSLPLSYISPLNPDSANISIIAGKPASSQAGTQIIVDELSFSFGTGINEEIVPLSAFLGKTYPNPSKDFVVINLTMSESSDISVEIYDATGRKVKFIDAGRMPAGNQMIKIGVSDLEAGVYYYKVQGRTFDLSEKFFVN